MNEPTSLNTPATQNDLAGLTPEQELTLEKARLERIEAESALIKQREDIERLENERKELLSKDGIKGAVEASGVRFYEPELAVTLARQQYAVTFDDDGNGFGVVDGNKVPLSEVLQAIALKHPTLCDQRTTRGLKPDTDDSKPKSKSEMTQAQKIDFVNKYGLEAYEMLPLYATRTFEIHTFEDYRKLPMQKRMALAKQHGPDWIASLPRENTPERQARRAGILTLRPKI